MKTKKKKKLTLYDVLIKNKRAEEDLRILRALVKEKKKRRYQHHKVQLKRPIGALGACGAIAAGISPLGEL